MAREGESFEGVYQVSDDWWLTKCDAWRQEARFAWLVAGMSWAVSILGFALWLFS